MKDLQHFLNWYLNPRARMQRGTFNVIFFLAFIPVLFLQIYTTSEKVEKISQQGSGIAASISGMMQSVQGGNSDVISIIRQAENLRHNTRLLDEVTGLTDIVSSVKQKKEESFVTISSKIIKFLIFIGLLPIVQMRLRDIGKKSGSIELWVYTGLIYVSVILDGSKDLLGIAPSPILISLFGATSFFILTWICFAKGDATYIAPSKRYINNPDALNNTSKEEMPDWMKKK